MTWPINADTDHRLLQAERDLMRAIRQTALTQERVAEAKEDVARAQAALAREQARSAQIQAALDQVYASSSWRLSHPVRVASRVIAALRGNPPPPHPAPLDEAATRPVQPALPPREAAILQRLRHRMG